MPVVYLASFQYYLPTQYETSKLLVQHQSDFNTYFICRPIKLKIHLYFTSSILYQNKGTANSTKLFPTYTQFLLYLFNILQTYQFLKSIHSFVERFPIGGTVKDGGHNIGTFISLDLSLNQISNPKIIHHKSNCLQGKPKWENSQLSMELLIS